MKNVTDNGNVPHDLSEEELQRLAEYFSILHEWSLQSKNVKDRGEDVATTTKATTSVDGTKVAPESDRKAPLATDDRTADK